MLLKPVWVEARKTTTTAKALYHVNEDLAGGAGFTGVCASSCVFFAILCRARARSAALVNERGSGAQIQGFPASEALTAGLLPVCSFFDVGGTQAKTSLAAL